MYGCTTSFILLLNLKVLIRERKIFQQSLFLSSVWRDKNSRLSLQESLVFLRAKIKWNQKIKLDFCFSKIHLNVTF